LLDHLYGIIVGLREPEFQSAVLRRQGQSAGLPDVFANKRANSPPSARFTVEEGGTKLAPIGWLDDGKPSADVLGRFSIFDSKCASVHVDGENRIGVVPHNLDCFERLAHVCDRLRARLKEECDGLEKQLAGALPEAPKGTAAEAFLAALSKKNEADLTAACKWSEADQKRLTELADLLKDPVAEAQKCERISAALKEFADQLKLASTALSDGKLAEIAALRRTAQDLRGLSNASAAAAFAAEPLRGVGEEPWRAMFDAARGYSEQHAYPGEAFPRVDADAQCVLCQQTFDAAAQDRFARFAGFVTGAMNAKAGAAEVAREAALLAIRPTALPIADLSKEARDYLAAANKPLGDNSAQYRNALQKRRTEVLAERDASEALPENPDAALRSEVTSLSAAAKEARALEEAGSAGAADIRAEHPELSGRKILHDNASELKRRIGIYEKIAKIGVGMKACATKDISDHGSKLLKTHVTEALALALEDEQKKLGITSIPLSLTDRTSKAIIQHRLRLNGATLAADTSAVLSEGEHRAVALAAFLSELRMYPSKDAIIIDDPVSSLDHVRRAKVAERLVTEGQERQVIVFTHDLVFLCEVRHYAAKECAPLRVLGIRRGPHGFGSLDPDGEPWLTKHLPGRRQWLEAQLARLKKLHESADPDYEIQLRFFYDRLRESWEKLIEERLFAQVVTRFQPQVQTMRLKEAVVDDDIVTQIHFGMTAVSSYTGHDRPVAKGGALADPVECEKDLKAFIKCLDETEV
jgi:ABC-type uncharacterized transport system ATPase subunit